MLIFGFLENGLGIVSPLHFVFFFCMYFVYVPLPFSQGRSSHCSDCLIFLSPLLDGTRMSMSTVSFLIELYV